jgi:hypothetical protein
MKKTLISIVAVTFVALMIANAYAVICVPAPPFCDCICYPPGFTPGFWKHNIEVRLGLTNGAYNAFEGGPLDGAKLTDQMMDDYLAAINSALGTSFSFEALLGYLELKGWDPLRTNTANWFNFVAGYGPFED